MYGSVNVGVETLYMDHFRSKLKENWTRRGIENNALKNAAFGRVAHLELVNEIPALQ